MRCRGLGQHQRLLHTFDFIVMRIKVLHLEGADRRVLRVGAVIDLVIELAVVAGDLAVLGVRNRQVEIPAVRALRRERLAYSPFRSEDVGHRRGNRRLAPGGAIEIDAHCALGIGRPDSHHRAGAVDVHHHPFAAALVLLGAQVLALIAVGEPCRLIVRRFRRAIVTAELPADVFRRGKSRQCLAIDHFPQK